MSISAQPLFGLLAASITLLSTSTCAIGQVAESRFFVAPDGNDRWSGTLPTANAARSDGPMASIQAARDAIRRGRADGTIAGPVRVEIAGGTYDIDRPIIFEPQDSGTEQAPIRYVAAPGEKPIFSSGRTISGWTKMQNGPIWTTVVPKVPQDGWDFWQLFVDGHRGTPARSPNDGFFRSAGPGVPYTDRTAARGDPKTKMSIRYSGDDLQPWSDLENAIVVVYHSWTASRHRIASLDTKVRRVDFTAPSSWPMGYWEQNQRYYVEFVREALDAPGEWHLDRDTGLLSYYPGPDIDMTKAELVAATSEELLRLDGDPTKGAFVDHLVFEGLSFQHTSWSMPAAEMVDGQANASLKTAAIFCRGARNCQFKGCEIAHTGGYGLWLQNGCKDNRVEMCHLHRLRHGRHKDWCTKSPARGRIAGRAKHDSQLFSA